YLPNTLLNYKKENNETSSGLNEKKQTSFIGTQKNTASGPMRSSTPPHTKLPLYIRAFLPLLTLVCQRLF
ncbi:MAG: hypothetical protein ACRCYK_02180, partial [Aeromonas hydrophila]